jgi:hypothetical protein
LALAGVLLWPAPYIGDLRPPNELVRLYLTRAIIDDHTLALDGQVARYGALADGATFKGKSYSDKAPGLSLLAVPLYGLLRVFVARDALSAATLLWLFRVVLIVLPTLWFLHLLAAFLARLSFERRVVLSIPVAYALATPALAYCMRFVGHQAAAWMLGVAIYLAHEGRAGRTWPRLASGFFAGLAGMTEYPTMPMLAVLALLTSARATKPWRGLVLFFAGSALPLLLVAGYHTLAFGGPFTTGYGFVTNPGFLAMHQQGLVGVGVPSPSALLALTIGHQRGLLTLAPWLVLALVGTVAVWQKTWAHERPLALALCANAVLLLWVSSGFGYWLGGWSVGPRHLVAALPAFAVLAAFGWQTSVRRLPWLAPVFCGLVLQSALQCIASAVTYPGFPEELLAPVWEQALPLLAAMQFSWSVGTLLGLRSDVAMWPALVLAIALLGWLVLGAPPWRRLAPAMLWRVGLAGWVAVATWGVLAATAPRPSETGVFRTAWLRTTMWQPKDVLRPLDPRLAAWEQARRAQREGRLPAESYDALAAVAAAAGNADLALRYYMLAAFGTQAPAQTATPTPDVTGP